MPKLTAKNQKTKYWQLTVLIYDYSFCKYLKIGNNLLFLSSFSPGHLAQLVQSTALTGQGSLVRIQ